MIRWVLRMVAVAALVAIGFWLWQVFFPNPERVIRQRLELVAKTASISAREGELAKVDNATRLAAFCTQDVQITVDVPGSSVHTLTGREDLLNAVLLARSTLSGLSVELLDISVQLDGSKTSAVVNLTAKARLSGERDLMVQELKLTMNKVKGDWLFSKVETVKTLM